MPERKPHTSGAETGYRGLRILCVALERAVVRGDAFFYCFRDDDALRQMIKRYSKVQLRPGALKHVQVDESGSVHSRGSVNAAWSAKAKLLDEFQIEFLGACRAAKILSHALTDPPVNDAPANPNALQHRIRCCLAGMNDLVADAMLTSTTSVHKSARPLLDELKNLSHLVTSLAEGLADHTPPLTRPRLGPKFMAIYDVIANPPNGIGIVGKEIIEHLRGQRIVVDQATLTRHIIPVLKQYGVRNRRSVGYFLERR